MQKMSYLGKCTVKCIKYDVKYVHLKEMWYLFCYIIELVPENCIIKCLFGFGCL